jgi:ABC-type tungstate transport system substrate-binding protein
MALALSVGHLRLRRWLNTMIEVDAAPPGILCRIKVYSLLSESGGLRHGLYMSENVSSDLVVILRELIEPSTSVYKESS